MSTTTRTLYQRLAQEVAGWRAQDYGHPAYPVVGELLRWAKLPADTALQLRPPQFAALESYWYLRLVAGTPTVLALYNQLFPDPETWRSALQIPALAWQTAEQDPTKFVARLTTDDEFVAQFKLESLRESVTLAYPSYIFALAMGVGKTVLIGAIIATEFALALHYPTAPFVQNALVFAPGRTILESLRALVNLAYQAVLPPHLYNPFAAAVKFIVPQDGARAIPVLAGSQYNVIITNTEKIRIQQEQIRKGQLGPLWSEAQVASAKAEVANLRLQAIASLPQLAIFSDEAHHTYGRALGDDLKKVRKTVDFLAAQTNVSCVINTTGTPYFRRQSLPDVVVWYGLAAGIRDGILKPVGDNIITYAEVAGTADAMLVTMSAIIRDFFDTYAQVNLPDGTPAKLAIYFPKTADIVVARPTLERLLVALGYAPTILLEHHTRCDNKADFDRFHQPQSPHRIALLVDRGVEGWDVPALFACALLRQLKTSNNFVLQAASRCLRQTPGNQVGARIYLSAENRALLARQLRDTYGETLRDLAIAAPHKPTPAAVAEPITALVPQPLPHHHWQPPARLQLRLPKVVTPTLQRANFTLDQGALTLRRTAELVEPNLAPALDLYTTIVEFSAIYRLELWTIYDALQPLYGAEGLIPHSHLPGLRRQIEAQCQNNPEATHG